MANLPFDPLTFCRLVPPMLRRKKITFAWKDNVNQLIFTKRREIDPKFVIPASHASRWQAVPEDDSSDSAMSSVDLDEGHSSRNLLSAQKNHEQQTNFTEEAKMLSEQLEKMQLPDSNVLMNVMEMLKLGKSDSLLKDHDYFRPRKRLASELLGDESWPSPKMLAMMASEMKNIAGTLVIDKKGEQRTKEPVIIDLISD